jgi:hypothetical protein
MLILVTNFNIILLFTLFLCQLTGPVSSDLPNKIEYGFIIFSLRATYPFHLTFFN